MQRSEFGLPIADDFRTCFSSAVLQGGGGVDKEVVEVEDENVEES